MKILEKDKVKQLLQIMQNKQHQHILHFSEGSHLLTKTLAEICKSNNSSYHLYCAKEVFYDKCMTKYINQSHMYISKFDLVDVVYMKSGIEFDYLLSTLDFTQKDKGQFLKKCYPLLRCGGDIIILLPKSKFTIYDEWHTILEKQGYGSTHIETKLFEHYDVIFSKRT